MDNLRKFYDKYSVYITRPRLEIATVVVIALCAIFVFVGNMPKQGVLKLDGDSLVYDGSIVRGKMNGKGTMTFSNGDTYTGEFKNGHLTVKEPTKLKKAGFMKGTLLMAKLKEKEN